MMPRDASLSDSYASDVGWLALQEAGSVEAVITWCNYNPRNMMKMSSA